MLNQINLVKEEENTTTSLTSQAYQKLHDLIIRGDLEPGLKLKIEDLRKSMGIGASPVREALSLLTSDQLVERIDQRGFRVSRVSVEAFFELLKTRCWVEEIALRESITNATAEWEEELILCHHRLKRARRQDKNEAGDHTVIRGLDVDWETQHKLFHLSLLSGCGSSILLKFCAQLYDQNIRYRYLSRPATTSNQSRKITDEHEEILTHILEKDADKAVAALIYHYQKTGKYLAERLEVQND